LKILIVDDTIDTVELLTKRLRAEGYDTEQAFDGQECLDKVEPYQPDLIILDVMMPKVDGFEACHRIKENEATKHIPILMLTAKSEIPDKVKGLDTGADSYLTKPFNYKELSANIRSLLTKKNATEKQAQKEKFFALDQMVDEVSHEIRNPLVSIGGFTRRIRNNLDKDDQNRKYLDIILQNVTTLERMMNHLIGLKQAAVIYIEETDINTVVLNSLAKHRKKITELGILLTTNLASDLPHLRLDTDNLTLALGNIIENGLEAMVGEKKELTIRTEITEGNVEISIKDTGKGIAREKIKNIYDPFYTGKTHGPGLGLYLALKIIQNNKGTIRVESVENHGTCIKVRLPIQQ